MSSKRIGRSLREAEGYLDLGMPQQALRILDRVGTGSLPGFRPAWLQAEALRLLGRHGEALCAYQTAQVFRPEDSDVMSAIAVCFKAIGRLERAIGAAQAAYRLSPDEPVCLYKLACYCCVAGQREQALSWLGRALRMDGSLRGQANQEPDFGPLRNDSHFRFIVDAGIDADSSATGA